MTNKQQPSMLSFIKDLPNICSLLGLFGAILAIYFAIAENFPAAIIGILWAVVFDWYDGIIARKLKGRTEAQGTFGAQLDSMIDMVSFGVFPAILLLSYGNYNVWYIPGAFIIVAATAIRLSYFNIYGLEDTNTYKGLAVDNNGIILAFVFIFESLFGHFTFSIILYGLLLTLSALNLSSIRTHKFAAKWVYVLVIYALTLTFFFGWMIYKQ